MDLFGACSSAPPLHSIHASTALAGAGSATRVRRGQGGGQPARIWREEIGPARAGDGGLLDGALELLGVGKPGSGADAAAADDAEDDDADAAEAKRGRGGRGGREPAG